MAEQLGRLSTIESMENLTWELIYYEEEGYFEDELGAVSDSLPYPGIGAWVKSVEGPASAPIPSTLILFASGVGILTWFRKFLF